MRWVADLAYLIAGVIYLPVVLYQALVLGKNRRGWGERFGFGRTWDRERRRIWIHAVSLGEVNATPHLIHVLGQRLPGYEIVVSTTTDTGFARAVQLYGRERVFRYPLDFSWSVARALRRVAPELIVLVELEVWPNLLRLASRRDVPVAVVNGRLTARSARRLAWLGPIARAMFGRLNWVGAQDDAIAARFRGFGVPDARVEVTSSLKWDTVPASDHVDGADALASAVGLDRSRPLWVCGSTGPGEEAIILSAYRQLRDGAPGLARRMQEPTAGGDARETQLAIVPRKPERFDEVARLIEREGFHCLRRTQCPDGGRVEASSATLVVLGDTMGELRKFYALADVVFVGRSLVPLGGSDPMEVAALGKPTIVGPHMENFQLPVDLLRAAEAVCTADSAETLAAVVRRLLTELGRAGRMGACARSVVLRHQGATQRTADRLVSLIGRGSSRVDRFDPLSCADAPKPSGAAVAPGET